MAVTLALADRLRLVVDSMDEGFGLLAPDFTILELNRQALRIDGRHRETVVGLSHWVAYPGTEESEVGETYKVAMRERTARALQHSYVWQDGRTTWFETRVFPTSDGCLAVFFRDVTDRHAVTQRLMASERRLTQIGESISDVLYVHEIEEGRIPYVSRSYEKVWGRPREELYANPESFIDAVHSGDQDRLRAALTRQRAGQDTDIEYRLAHADGEERIIHDRAFASHDPVTGALRITGLATDISAYRRAELQAARSAETFASLVRSNPFGIYVIDPDFRLIELSEGARPVFSHIRPLIGGDFATIVRELWTEPFASEVIHRFRTTLATGEPYLNPSTVEVRADTRMVEAYDWRLERITLPDGQRGVVCYFYNLSERHGLEARLRQALADKDLLAREIDHRVKNSLAIVTSLLDMQRHNAAEAETQAALDQAARRVAAIARVHEGLHKSQAIGVVAFGPYLRALGVGLGESLARPGIALRVAAGEVDLPADTALSLALVANELVTNAFKHGATAGASIITLRCEQRDGALVMTVEDDGSGMPARPAAAPGGLGLQLIEALARQLDAAFEAPRTGETSRFRFVMPLAGPVP